MEQPLVCIGYKQSNMDPTKNKGVLQKINVVVQTEIQVQRVSTLIDSPCLLAIIIIRINKVQETKEFDDVIYNHK